MTARARPPPFQRVMARVRRAAPHWRCTICGATAKPHILFGISSPSLYVALPDRWQIVNGEPACGEHPETRAVAKRLILAGGRA